LLLRPAVACRQVCRLSFADLCTAVAGESGVAPSGTHKQNYKEHARGLGFGHTAGFFCPDLVGLQHQEQLQQQRSDAHDRRQAWLSADFK
jgi:hypothetical protein